MKKISTESVYHFGMYVVLIALCTSPAFALGAGGRNLLLIGVMGVLPVVVIRHFRYTYTELLIVLYMLLLLALPLLFHRESIRWSTLLYSCMFAVLPLGYFRLLRYSGFTLFEYGSFLKILIYAYAIVLVIQQICILMGLPVFLVSAWDPALPMKLNSLTSEPSHSVRYVALMMYCLIVLREVETGKGYSFSAMRNDGMVWLAFLWVMLSSLSATGYLFLGIIGLRFVRWRNLIPLTVGTLFVAGAVVVSGQQGIFERAYQTGLATLSLDEESIVKADHSGSARIVPMIICAKMIEPDTREGWTGHGIDYVKERMYLLFPGVEEGYTGGGIFLVGVEYGLIVFFLFLFFSLTLCYNKKDKITLLFWVFMCLNEGVNMQITWCAILLLYTNKYLTRDYEKYLIDCVPTLAH